MLCYVMLVHRSDQKIANLYYDSAVVNYDCNLFIRIWAGGRCRFFNQLKNLFPIRCPHFSSILDRWNDALIR